MESFGETLGRNVAHLRKVRGFTVRSLSARLDELGTPVSPSGITKIEQNARDVRADELVGLAISLGVNPSRLVLPVDRETIELTPTVRVPSREAWDWADGRSPLSSAHSDGTDERWAFDDFMLHARPTDRLWSHMAMQAANETAVRIERLVNLDVEDDTEDHKGEIEAVEHALASLQAQVADLIRSTRQVRSSLDG